MSPRSIAPVKICGENTKTSQVGLQDQNSVINESNESFPTQSVRDYQSVKILRK
jgi:hypothetical protein